MRLLGPTKAPSCPTVQPEARYEESPLELVARRGSLFRRCTVGGAIVMMAAFFLARSARSEPQPKVRLQTQPQAPSDSQVLPQPKPQPQPRRYANLDERTVDHFVTTSPSDYIGAVVEVVATCSMDCAHQCFDRVRIVELIAQAPPPAAQLAVGSEFHISSGAERGSKLPDPAPRYLALVKPWLPSSCPDKAYMASGLAPAEAERIKSYRAAFAAIVGK